MRAFLDHVCRLAVVVVARFAERRSDREALPGRHAGALQLLAEWAAVRRLLHDHQLQSEHFGAVHVLLKEAIAIVAAATPPAAPGGGVAPTT